MGAREVFEALRRGGWATVEQWCEPPGALEDEHLEFKCARPHADGPAKLSDDARADIAKAVSGFANAGGGVLVVGVKANRPADRGPDRVSGTCLVRELPAIERAVQDAMPGLTEPSVRGIEVLAVANPATPGQGIVAIYVPASDGGPHRTSNVLADRNERYYIRHSTSSGVMSHATLLLMFGRPPAPQLRIIVRKVRAEGRRMEIFLKNFGRGTAERPALMLEYSHETKLMPYVGSAVRWHSDSAEPAHGRSTLITFPKGGQVLYPTMEERVIDASIRDSSDVFQVRGTIFALGAQPVHLDQQVRWDSFADALVLPDDAREP